MGMRARASSFVAVGSSVLLHIAANACGAAHASGQAVVTRVTGPQPWRAASGESDNVWYPERNEMAISKDGKWVVFESQANNLTSTDHNPYADIFVFEVATGRVVGITSNQWFAANAWSYDPAISADGRYVVFATNASNLIANDGNNNSDVFLVDRDPDANGIFDEQAYVYERISVDSSGNETHGACISPCISDDGTRVLFLSDAPDLDAGDYNGFQDAFLRDRSSGTTTRVDVDSIGNEANAGCSFADLSADGNVVAFTSSSDNLVLGDSNGVSDVFVHDLTAGATERVSVDDNGKEGNARSYVYRHGLSADGTYVVFQSDATNLDKDTNGFSDVFVHTKTTGTTRLVSLDSKGRQGNGDSWIPTISRDGKQVAFASTADLGGKDGNGTADVFLRDLSTGKTSLVTVGALSGAAANGWSLAATISSDGTQVVFSSTASDLVDMGDVAGFRDVFLADLVAGTMRYVSAVPAGEANGASCLDGFTSISQDGRYVAFVSAATNLVDGDQNGRQDVFVFDRTTGSTVRVSVSSSGDAADGDSFGPSLSVDGRFVAFGSWSTNLVDSDTNSSSDIFRHDRDPDGNGIFDENNGVTIRVSVDSLGTQGNANSAWPSISGDGNRIAFHSIATNLDPHDAKPNLDIFVHDVAVGTTKVLSVNSSIYYSVQKDSFTPSISGDGNTVAFTSYNNYRYDFDGRDFTEYAVYLVGVDGSGPFWIDGGIKPHPGDYAYAWCGPGCLSNDGSSIVFSHLSDVSGVWEGFVGITPWGKFGQVSGVFQSPSDWVSVTLVSPCVSADGRTMSFATTHDNVVPGDANGQMDVFLCGVGADPYGDAINAGTWLVSDDQTSNPGTGNYPALSGNGDLAVFASDGATLVPNDANGCRDVFLFDRTRAAHWSNYGSGFAGPHAIPAFTLDAPPVLGTVIHMSLANSSGIPVTALVYLSTHSANDLFPWGATLLVDLSTAISFVVPLDAVGATLVGDVPNDPSLSGVSVYLQALERDDAVPHRLSFTPGLELHFGR